MFPGYLIRAGIDWVRSNKAFQDLDCFAGCRESMKICRELFDEQIGKTNSGEVEPAVVAAYWAEVFHTPTPGPKELEWREMLLKPSGQHDSFEEWQEWFLQTYATEYQEDDIWTGAMMTPWAHTHQYEVVYTTDAWELRVAKPYLQTGEMWRFEPHMETVGKLLRELWKEEVEAYRKIGFDVNEEAIPYLGKPEALGFDTKKYIVIWPPRTKKDPEELELGDIIADIILPPGDDWYRHLDSVIFGDNHVDITALCNRAKYMLGSRRRLFELSIDNDFEEARMRAAAEGWLVPQVEGVAG